jgi:hypothetical protein
MEERIARKKLTLCIQPYHLRIILHKQKINKTQREVFQPRFMMFFFVEHVYSLLSIGQYWYGHTYSERGFELKKQYIFLYLFIKNGKLPFVKSTIYLLTSTVNLVFIT